MFCAQRLQRLIQAFILGFVMGLAAIGMAGDQTSLQIAFLVQFAMMVMLFIAGVTGWCPGLIFLRRFFPDCEERKA